MNEDLSLHDNRQQVKTSSYLYFTDIGQTSCQFNIIFFAALVNQPVITLTQ